MFDFSGKRAAYTWARDRAAVASRWSWLLAQISDLEYRIRQHNELHNHIKKSKGPVTFEEPNQNQQQQNEIEINQPSTSSGLVVGQSVNGYRGILPGNSKITDIQSHTNTTNQMDTLESNSSCRTKAFQRSGFRKRKLLQTVNLHTISKKAARSRLIIKHLDNQI